ncbi:hypothetical protein MMC34_000571 [Xylographa carneopallida]|nr:hypothetical protein [Xylographa carneopallida]
MEKASTKMERSSTHTERPSTPYLGKVARNMAKEIGFKGNVDYMDRQEVRIIVTNQKQEIVIVLAQNGVYYGLPREAINADEDHQTAAEREATRATSCPVMIEASAWQPPRSGGRVFIKPLIATAAAC